MIEKIKKELENLNSVKQQAEEIISNAPEGKLRCATNKGYYQYYLGKEYLGKDKRGYATKIAQRDYCLKLNKMLEKYRIALEELLLLYESEELEDAYRKLHPARKELVEPLIKPIEDVIDEFEKLEYKSKEFDEDDKTEYYTVKGERVRSKSEKIIADELYRYGIPYKYEMPLELFISTFGRNNKCVQFYPDFTALNKRTGKRWIIEHLGMMDKPSYYESTMRKIDVYEKNNLLLGRDLILLHESSNTPLNTSVVKQYIELYLC